jgi:hypothetical protein
VKRPVCSVRVRRIFTMCASDCIVLTLSDMCQSSLRENSGSKSMSLKAEWQVRESLMLLKTTGLVIKSPLSGVYRLNSLAHKKYSSPKSPPKIMLIRRMYIYIF